MPPHAQPRTASLGGSDGLSKRKAKVRIENIGRYPNWDKRECQISNAAEWRARVNAYIDSHEDRPVIPKKIHQIWIGTREPPCIWLDSWRLDFLADHGQDWEYKLWDNESVAEMREEEEMINGDLFHREAMWQCKADLLRLEILYRHGGVYIDADMISLGKSLDEVLNDSRETGFGVSYEADTKDKPYSILGNSIIFASKGHPLLLLLIHYIRMIYDHKRPYFGVEWVTGPLAFTKAILFSDMPLSMIPRDYFYATFQYVPNPSCVDTSHFPHSLGFQFGYTCSGLGDWVKANNKCRKALDCAHHKKRMDYPFGAIEPFWNEDECVKEGDIPRVIHQFCFSQLPPTRWIESWSKDFCLKNSGWTHKLWNYDDLVQFKRFFCAHLYGPDMDEETMKLLALEVLFKEGGYYVPLTTTYQADGQHAAKESSFPPPHANGIAAAGSIIGSVKNGRSIFKAIQGSYELGRQPKLGAADMKSRVDVVEMQFPDSVSSYMSFAPGSRFLGAGEVYFPVNGRGGKSASSRILSFAYDSQVPCFPFHDNLVSIVAPTGKSAVIITDPSLLRNVRVVDSIAGLIYETVQQDPDWDFIGLTLEWRTGHEDLISERAITPTIRPVKKCFGLALNLGRAKLLEELPIHDPSSLLTAVLSRCHRHNVYVGTVRFEHDEGMSAIYAAMGIIGDVFWRVAGHAIPSWDRDYTEMHGRLMKGMRNHQVGFEISVSTDHRIMYRSFNDDGAMNSEARIIANDCSQIIVEYARVFFDHHVIFDQSNIRLSRTL